MDFVDYRKDPNKLQEATEEAQDGTRRRLRGKNFSDYIEEIIMEAQERGEFSNLEGMGKPLNLEDERGDMAMAYHVLKGGGYAPPEIELSKDIQLLRERAEARLEKLIRQNRQMRSRRVAPFASERRAYNASVQKAATEYEQSLREINNKILTLNISAPASLHQPLLSVERLVQQFRESCPLFPEE
jgi:DnaJ family protein C protein 28